MDSFSMAGWMPIAKRMGPRGSPCCTPCSLLMVWLAQKRSVGCPRDFCAQGTRWGARVRRLARMALRSIVLNALIMSMLRQAQFPVGPSASMHAWRVVPAISHAPWPLNPSWWGRSVARARTVSSARMRRLPKRRRRVSPIAIGRTPSPFFLSGTRRLAHSHSAIRSCM